VCSGLPPRRCLSELPGIFAEPGDVAALEQGTDLAAQIVDVVFGAEGGIAAGDTRQDHVGAIAEGNLAILPARGITETMVAGS